MLVLRPEYFEEKFFSGRILSTLMIKPLDELCCFQLAIPKKIHKKALESGVIPTIPDDSIYDIYHNNFHEAIFKKLVKTISNQDVVEFLRKKLYADPKLHVEQKTAVSRLVSENFDAEIILEILSRHKAMQNYKKFKLFNENSKLRNSQIPFDSNIISVNRQSDTSDPMNLQTYQKDSATRFEETGQSSVINKYPQSLSKRAKTKHMNFDLVDFKFFEDKFEDFQQKKMSLKTMLGELKILNPRFECMSLTFFYTHFIKRQGFHIVHRKLST